MDDSLQKAVISSLIILTIVSVLVYVLLKKTYFSKTRINSRKLKKETLTAISMTTAGTVQKIEGTVGFLDNRLISPFGQKACVFYRSVVKDLEPDGHGGGAWRTILVLLGSVSFRLSDASGGANVEVGCKEEVHYGDYGIEEFEEAQNVHINLKVRRIYKTGLFRSIPDHFAKILDANEIPYRELFGTKRKLKFYETCIAEGDKMHLLGMISRQENNNVSIAAASDIKLIIGVPSG
jgi:hypothetical protein